MHFLINAIAKQIFNTFPNQRRAICIAALILCFLMPLPIMLFIWTGNAEHIPPGWGVPLLVLAGVGIVGLIFAYRLLQEINRMGSPDERP